MSKQRNSCGFAVQCVLVSGLLAITSTAFAANISTTGSDGFGASSFNSGGVWSDGLAPSAGNDYFIEAGNRVRTPPDGGSYTFAGDSLTVRDGGSSTDLIGLSYKGAGNTGTITIDNLILDGGSIDHINGSGDVFNLDGNLNVASDSMIYAKQGPIYIYSDISGSGQITVPASDTSTCKLWLASSANTYTGNIVNNGRLGLLDDANLNFVIGASGVNNSVTSPGGQQHVTFDGDFVFDLSGAGTTLGDSWSVIGTTAASTYYGTTFNVVGFTPLGDDSTWLKEIGPDLFYAFHESNGLLHVIPEPATLVMGLMCLTLLRRRA